MACLTPIKIKGRLEEDGMIRSQGHVIVPCGSCPGCRDARANAWVMRLLEEEKKAVHSHFITLTYETAPLSPYHHPTLVKSDFQNFMKRLRKMAGEGIKYYACGEYGSTTDRPHYHAIVFNCHHDFYARAWALDKKPIGHVKIGTVTGGSVAYTCKYICKERQKDPVSYKLVSDDRQPEFSLMSKGIGTAYLTPEMVKWHKSNLAAYYVKEGGYTASLPRYFKRFIFDDYEKKALFDEQQERYSQEFNSLVAHFGSQNAMYLNNLDLAKQKKFTQFQRNTI